LVVSLPIQFRIWRRAIPIAWEQTQLAHPAKLVVTAAIPAVNIFWKGHGVLRVLKPAPRFILVAAATYALITVVEFLWLLATGPRFTGFESATAEKEIGPDKVDALAAELSALAPAELRDETLDLAKEMKAFEAGSDREFVNTLAGVEAATTATESEHDEALDKQSAELMEHNLRTWRVYRDRFYRPARAFRDELRKRLGIRNMNSEPWIPALDRALLVGAKPIAQAADYLAGLARRLK
jgi:hypothetical protein